MIITKVNRIAASSNLINLALLLSVKDPTNS